MLELFRPQAFLISAKFSVFLSTYILRSIFSRTFLKEDVAIACGEIPSNEPQLPTVTLTHTFITGYINVVGRVMWFHTVCFYTIRK
jgi:hypothetical protein